MNGKNFLQGFGFKGEGIGIVIFLMGLFMKVAHVLEFNLNGLRTCVGDMVMLFAVFLCVVDYYIILKDKVKKAKMYCGLKDNYI